MTVGTTTGAVWLAAASVAVTRKLFAAFWSSGTVMLYEVAPPVSWREPTTASPMSIWPLPLKSR